MEVLTGPVCLLLTQAYKYLGDVAFVTWFIKYFDGVEKSFGDSILYVVLL